MDMSKLKKIGAAVALCATSFAVMAQESGGGSGAGTAFTSAVTQAGSNVATFGAALVTLAAVGVAFMIGIKYVKKIRGAA